MWPQKWNASASVGATSEPTVRTPAATISASPARARKPRRELPAARRSTASAVRSATPPGHPPLRRGQDRLELAGRVERALGQDRPVGAERDRVRAARHVGGGPRAGLPRLVERAQDDARMKREALDRGLERAAHPAALRGEDGERGATATGRFVEPVRERARAVELRSLARDLERPLGPQDEPQLPAL